MKLIVIVLLAVAATVKSDLVYDGYWDEFYTLHNNYRSQQGLGELHVDVNIEGILQSAGFVTGHGHSQKNNLNSYAKRVTGSTWTPAAIENYAGSQRFRQTPQGLLNQWLKSPGHKKTILGQKGPKWDAFGCAYAKRGRDYSFLCAYREKGTCGSIKYKRTSYASVSYLRCEDRSCC